LLRPASPTLGLYLRPRRNDDQALSQLLAEGDLAVTGLIFNPCLEDQQHDLMEEARQRGIEVILDPRSLELSTVGGFSLRSVVDLPWASDRPHLPDDLRHSEGKRLIEELADYAVEHACSAVLAPSHYASGLGDPWLTVDRTLVDWLREALNSRGANSTLIYYPLIISSALLRSAETRVRLAEVVGPLPVDAIWLRVHSFGTTHSGPLALHRYIDTCRQLHKLHLPLVGERTGTVGWLYWRLELLEASRVALRSESISTYGRTSSRGRGKDFFVHLVSTSRTLGHSWRRTSQRPSSTIAV